jgi:acetylornithine deacetylase/succinyl-diaminopimelate desuccinylase-like protein
MALILLQRAGLPLKGTLRLASCADEEAGGAFGFGWMVEHHPELLRADLAINEGGGAPTRRGDQLIYPISTGEKGRLEVHYRIRGRGYHASQPWMADNAIYKADDLIQRIRAYQPEVSVDVDLFRHLDTLTGIDEPVTVDNLESMLGRVGEANPTLASFLRAASRMTLVASMINGGVKSNSVAEGCTVVCDIRSLPWQDREYVRGQLQGLIGDLEGVSLELIETAVSNNSPFDSEYRPLVEAATRDAVGDVGAELAFVPGLTVGFTDSRFVRPLGDVAYGFVPMSPNDDPSKSGAHNINESCAIDSLITATKFHVALAYRALVSDGGA